jgi:arabinose-5-phosphate isomerase
MNSKVTTNNGSSPESIACDNEIGPSVHSDKDFAEIGRSVLHTQAEALHTAAERLNDSFNRAADIIYQSAGKVIVTGLGKSGHVAHKIAATLCSTGTAAVFLHAADATHGDLGVCSRGDPAILISKSGATVELLRLVPVLRSLGCPLIGILGNLSSPLAAEVNIVLDARVTRECDDHNLVPTSSTTITMAIGDALAVALMRMRQFSQQDFARYHPSGQLGRNLWLSVVDVMHQRSKTACVTPGESLHLVVIAMSRHPLGAACVVNDDGTLAGVITDGDLRRTLQQHQDIRTLRACDIMTPQPITIPPTASLKQAELLMEGRRSQISVLPVTDDHSRYLGLVRLHDLYRSGQ